MYKKVYLEITNICNLNCPFCIKNQRKMKYMSEEEFKLILEKLKGHTKYLYFHLLGEPTMHPNFSKFIKKASDNDFYVNITTNGYLIDRINPKDDIRQINISLHSFDEKYGKTLEEYMENIFKKVDTLKEKTYISYRLWANNKNALRIVELLAKHYNTPIDLNTDKRGQTLEKNVFFSKDQEFEWPNLEKEAKEEAGTCYALKDHIGILVDGTIVPCCLDSKGDIPLGNIFNDDLEEIQKSDRYQRMLKGFKEKRK